MPDFYYKLLLDIYKKPYIGYAVLRSKYPHKQDFEFQQAFEFFQFNDYIVINPFKSADTDTGEVFHFINQTVLLNLFLYVRICI